MADRGLMPPSIRSPRSPMSEAAYNKRTGPASPREGDRQAPAKGGQLIRVASRPGSPLYLPAGPGEEEFPDHGPLPVPDFVREEEENARLAKQLREERKDLEKLRVLLAEWRSRKLSRRSRVYLRALEFHAAEVRKAQAAREQHMKDEFRRYHSLRVQRRPVTPLEYNNGGARFAGEKPMQAQCGKGANSRW